MRLLIKKQLDTPISLPISYNRILQGVIYDALKTDAKLSTSIHDNGYGIYNKNFKQFTFSPLKGKYEVHGKTITFRNDLTWEIRSPKENVIRLIQESFRDKGIRLGNQKLDNLNLELLDNALMDGDMVIEMKAPLCEYSTDEVSRQTYYYTPEQRGFYELTKRNAIKKYQAYFGESCDGEIQFEPIYVTRKDKVLTKYKDIVIEAWGGQYRLCGDRKMLDFLYNTGLGSKNSQGFGMFDVVAEGEEVKRILAE